MKGKENLADRYREFLSSEIFNECKKDGDCCRHFGHDGTRIEDFEKESITKNLVRMGLDDIAEYVKINNTLPTTKDRILRRKCLLLKNNLCLLHDISKPKRCVEFPIYFVKEKNNLVKFEIDVSCNNINAKIFQNYGNINNIKKEFKKRFNKNLNLIFTHSIEDRVKRYYGD